MTRASVFRQIYRTIWPLCRGRGWALRWATEWLWSERAVHDSCWRWWRPSRRMWRLRYAWFQRCCHSARVARQPTFWIRLSVRCCPCQGRCHQVGFRRRRARWWWLATVLSSVNEACMKERRVCGAINDFVRCCRKTRPWMHLCVESTFHK